MTKRTYFVDMFLPRLITLYALPKPYQYSKGLIMEREMIRGVVRVEVVTIVDHLEDEWSEDTARVFTDDFEDFILHKTRS